MFFLFFFSIFFLISIIGYGYFFKKKIILLDNESNLGELGILGLFLLTFLATFFHFFLAIGKNFNLVIHIIGIIFFFLNFKEIFNIFNKEKKFFISLYFFSLLIFYQHKPNEDFGFYHLPYVVNFTSEKIIIGLSNLQIQQGWNSIWLNLHSIFYFEFLEYKGVYLLNSFLFIFICNILLNCIVTNFQNNNSYNKIIFYFSFIFLNFFLIKFSSLNSYGLDVPGNFLTILGLFYFLKIIFEKKNQTNFFKVSCLVLVFAFTVRIGNVLFLLLLLFIFFKKNFYTKILFTKFFLFIFLFLLVWIIQQFLYTGCLVFPYNFLCFDNLSWSDPNFISKFQQGTSLANKSYELYKGNLTIEEYSKNFNWVAIWFQRNKIELFEYIGPFIVVVLFTFILSKKILILKKNKSQGFDVSTLFVIVFLSFIVWFVNSPVIRMGNHFFLCILFFLIFYPPIFNKSLLLDLSKKSTIFILFLSFSVFSYKNFIRIDKNNNAGSSPWPIFEKINFQKEKINDFTINLVIKGKTHQSNVCWDTSFLCASPLITELNILKIKRGRYIIMSSDY
jgi:hypothetical protein